MDPFSLIGAAGGIVGGIMGADAQDEANQTNWQIALMNYYQRERERRQAKQQADEIRGEQKLGATDASGNRTHFVAGKGWVTELSDTSQSINDAQNREQLLTLNHDLPMKRRQLDQNEHDQGNDRAMAGGLQEMFRRQLMNKENPEDIESLLYSSKSRGINEAFDSGTNTAMRGAIRSGNSNTGKILADIMKQRGQAQGEAAIDAKIAAPDYIDKQQQGRLASMGNLYNMFATRGAAIPGVSYQAQNVDGEANNLMQSFAQQAQSGNQAAMQAVMKQGGTFDYKAEPNFGLANTIVNAGGALQSAFSSTDPNRLKKDAYT